MSLSCKTLLRVRYLRNTNQNPNWGSQLLKRKGQGSNAGFYQGSKWLILIVSISWKIFLPFLGISVRRAFHLVNLTWKRHTNIQPPPLKIINLYPQGSQGHCSSGRDSPYVKDSVFYGMWFFFSLFKLDLSCREKELEMEGEVTKGQLTRDSGIQGDGHLKVAVVYLLYPKFKFESIRAGCLLHFQLRLCFPIPLPDWIWGFSFFSTFHYPLL